MKGPRKRPTKVRKHVMTVDELRASYKAKIVPIVVGGDRNLLGKVMHELIMESEWRFMDVMYFIQDPVTAGDAKLSVLISDHLTRDNLQWRHWFFAEFPEIVRDLRLDPRVEEIPYPWLQRSLQKLRTSPGLRHEDDVLFLQVPWRSCYMWTAMFERRCRKYYADFCLHSTQRVFGPVGRTILDTVKLVEYEEGEKDVVYLPDPDDDPAEESIDSVYAALEHHVDVNAVHLYTMNGWDIVYGSVYKAWCAWRVFLLGARIRGRLYRNFGGEEGTYVIAKHPRAGSDRQPTRSDEGVYTYNFEPRTVESFIRWYCIQMVNNGRLATSQEEHDEHYEQFVGVYRAYDPFPLSPGNLMTVRLSIHDGSIRLGFLDVDDVTQEEHWRYLEDLAMCPRRTHKGDPERRAVQFLGARDLGE